MRRPLAGIAALALAWALAPGTSAAPRVGGLPDGLKDDPEAQGFADLLFANGMVAMADRDWSAAYDTFQLAAETYPQDATYAYFAGVSLTRLGRPAEAADAIARTLPPARNRAPEARVRFDLGEAQYLRGDLEAARAAFEASIRLDPKDGWAHFYLGLVLFSQKRNDEAFPEFQKAAKLEPALAADGAYYLGVMSYQGGNVEDARRYFEEAGRGAPSPAVASSGKAWLHALETAPGYAAVPKGEIRVGLGVDWDDNPRLVDDLAFFPPQESDVRGVLQLRAAGQPWIDVKGWTIGGVLNGYLSYYDDLSTLDLAGLQGVAQAAWGKDPVGHIDGPLGYARTPLGESRFAVLLQAGAGYFDVDGDSLRRDYEAAASFVIGEPGFGKTQFDLRWGDRTFFEPAGNDLGFLTATEASIRAGQYFRLGKSAERWIRVAADYTDTSTDEDLFGVVSYASKRVGLVVDTTQPIGKRWSLFFRGAFARERYDESPSTFFDRDVDHLEASAAVVYAFVNHFYWTLRYQWEDRKVDPDSFQAAFGYERQIASTAMTFWW